LALSKECDQILVIPMNNYLYPKGVGQILVSLWTSCDQNSIALKWWESCHNPSLGLVTKARACEGAGQVWIPGVTFHAPESARKYEPSHSQVSSHFGSWSLGGLPNFQRAIVGVKTHWIEESLTSLESFWNLGVRMTHLELNRQVIAKKWAENQIGNLTINH
jgi:hypothetical protein